MFPKKSPYSSSTSFQRKTSSRAPSQTVSENWGRRGGFFGAEDITTSGYESVLLYVRKGLGHTEIIQPVIDFILAVQKGVCKKWPLVHLSFGWGNELKHFGSGFSLGYTSDWNMRERIAKEVCRLAGDELDRGDVEIPNLYPATGGRSLYGGKTRVNIRDLLVFVDLEGGIVFHKGMRYRFPSTRRSRMVLAEVSMELEKTIWKIAPKELRFSGPEEFKAVGIDRNYGRKKFP